jgi:hypothetical protein
VFVQAGQNAAVETAGKTFAVMVREDEWKDTVFELNGDRMVNELEDKNKKMDAMGASAINWKPTADLNNYNKALQHWKKYIGTLIDVQLSSVLPAADRASWRLIKKVYYKIIPLLVTNKQKRKRY